MHGGFSRFPFARSVAALIVSAISCRGKGRCRHPRGPSFPDPGPVYPRPRNPSIPYRYSWKTRSICSSGRACHPHACGACPSACCAGKAALSALRVHCIDAAADQLPLPLQFSTTRWKSAPSSLQSVLSWDLMVLLHKSLCTYHSAICVAGKAAGPGTHGGQQTLKNMTGSLFESNNHLSQHNIGPKSSPSL